MGIRSLSQRDTRRGGLTAFAVFTALLGALASPARAVNVGYYDMSLGAGNATQVAPITAAGHTAVQLSDLQAADLAGIDVLFVQNPSNGSYGAEYLSRLSSIEGAISDGLILVLHDRFVTGAASVLPGGGAFVAQRNLTAPASNDINVLDATSPVVNGVAGVISSTSLDGGSFSSHGYVESTSLPAGAKRILWRPDPADALSRNRLVTFAYGHGDGAVLYSTIPLDLFLAGSGPNPPRANFTGIYAPNVVQYAALLSGGAPDLSVTITDRQAAAVPGEPVIYSVVVENSGIGGAAGAAVGVDLAAALTGVSWTCVASGDASCTAAGSGDVADLVDIGAGETLTYTLTGTVSPAATGTLASSAAVAPPTGLTDPVPANNTAADTDTLTPEADLVVEKRGPATVAPGGNLVYTLTVRNAGPSNAAAVTLSDPTPSALAFVAAGSPCAGGFPCNLGPLAAGSQVVVTATWSVPDPYMGPDPIVNLATAHSATPDPAPANNAARATTPAGGIASADLRLLVSGPPAAATGSSVTYTLRVTNLGPHDAADVQLSHTPPPGLFLLAASAPCTLESFCSLGTLNAGAEVVVRVTFGIPGGFGGAGPLVYSATVSGTTADPVAANNQASASVPLGADTADLAVEKVGPTAGAQGADLTYTITVTNRGPASAPHVILSDATPAGLTFVTADAPCAAGFPCDLGTLAAGASVRVHASFHVPAAYAGDNPIRNTASVASDRTEGAPADNSATALTGVGAEVADLSVEKRGPTTVAAGGEVTYTFLVVNHGPGVAHDTVLSETAPGALTLVHIDAPCSSTTFSCDLGDLPPGTTRALGVTYRVAANHVSPNPLLDTATVASDAVDPVPANDTSSASTQVVYRADLRITKSDGLTRVSPGFPVTYTIAVTNAGPSDVAGAQVTDTFPAALTGVSWTCAVTAGGGGTSCGAASGSGSLAEIVNLKVGGTVTYTVHATVAAGASGTLANTATVAVPVGVADPVPGNNSATDSDAIVLPVDLVVDKSGPASVTAGSSIVYTLTVTNGGPGTASSVMLADPTPTGLTFVSASPCPTGQFPCPLPDLGPQQSAQVTATYAVPAGYSGPASITNTATVSSATPESDPSDDSDTLVTPVVFSSNLAITKSDGRDTVVPGEVVTYTLQVSNAGPSHATGATVTDTPPALLLSPSWSCAAAGGATCGAASGTGAISQTVSIPVGGSLTYTLTATVDPAANTAVVNTATVAVAATAVDPVPGNNTASDTSGLAPRADLAVTKTDGRSAAVPGEPLAYTVVVNNAGPSDVTGATVADTLPAALTGPTWTCTGAGGAACPNASGSGNLSETVALPAGGSLTYRLAGTVDAAVTGTLANTATVAAPAAVTDPVAGNNSATDSEPLTRVADLTLTQTGPGTASRGGTISLAFTVTNAGPSAAAVQLTAPVPAGLTLVSAGAPCAGGFPCSLGTLAPGGQVQLTAIYQVPAAYAGPDPVVHLSALASDASDPHPADNAARSATAIDRAGQADLSVAKSAPAVAAVGSQVTYLLTVTNHGPDDAVSVSLGETVPAGLVFVSATAPCQSGFLCDLGTLAAGASRSVAVTFSIPASYSGPNLVVNQGSVNSITADPNPANNSAGATTTLVAGPADLAVTKRGPVSVNRGENLVYTLEVTNHGPATATNTRLFDATPPGLTFVSSTCPGGGGFPCFLDTLASGQTKTVEATFHVPAGYAGPNPIVNTASVEANELDGVEANDSASLATGVGVPAADLAVAASGPAQARAGELVSYEILVRNLGPGTAAAVSLAGPVPAGTSFVAATAPCAGGFPCVLGDLPAGSAVAVLAIFRLGSGLAAGTTVTYTATATDSAADPRPGNDSGSATTTVTVQADLAITKSDGITELAPGQTTTYVITVTNHGPSDAPGTRVIDDFPATVTSVSWTCTASAGSSCAPGASGNGDIDRTVSLAAGGTVTYTAIAAVSPAATGTLTNTARVVAPAGVSDPVPGNDSAVDTDSLVPRADLRINKTDGAATAVPGRNVTYTITVTNDGPSDATGVTVADTFPAALSNVAWTCTATAGSSCAASGAGSILDTVVLRASGTVTYTATGLLSPAAAEPLINTATVAPPAGVTDPVPGNNSATDTDTLSRIADLKVEKTSLGSSAILGGQVSYTIVVTNLGPSNVAGVTVTDLLPATLQQASWTCTATSGSSCGTAAGNGDIQQTVSLAAPGPVIGAVPGSVTYTLTATLAENASGPLLNTATAAVPGGVSDPGAGNNSSTVSLPVTPRPLSFYTLPPCRAVDTRLAPGQTGGPALASGVERQFQITGHCGVPATARSVAANLTVVQPTGPGFLQAFPDGLPVPTTSVLNFAPGQIRANNAVLTLGTNGALRTRGHLADGGSVHLLLDVVGYFQ